MKTPENELALPISNRLFAFTSQSGIHVFQSILSKQPRLNCIPFISVFVCLFLFLFCFFFVDLSDEVVEKQKVYVFFKAGDTCIHRGATIQQRARRPPRAIIGWLLRPRIVDDLGPWELKITKSKMARGRQCRRHGWFFSRFSSILQGQQRLQADKVLTTVEGIVLRSFRNACGNDLPKIW